MKKHRKADGVFVAEGHKLVGDLLPAFECRYIAATSDWLRQHAEWIERHKGLEVDEVTDEELRKVSFQETPQQVLAVFSQPVYALGVMSDVASESASDIASEDASDGMAYVRYIAQENLCLMLDDVQNPGNLGTIVRLADWFGIEHIFCSCGCADLYNPKTVQATMGAMARVKVHYVDLAEALASLDADTPVYGTFLDGENMYGKQLAKQGVIVMGNEGNGISSAVEAFVTERLYIPNYPAGRKTSESLNVAIATAIVCAEFRRR